MADEGNRPTHDPLGSKGHSVPRGQRLPDALDPDDTGQPNREHSGPLKDGVDATPEELQEQNLRPGGEVEKRRRRGELS